MMQHFDVRFGSMLLKKSKSAAARMPLGCQGRMGVMTF
jgi:hypothetical protein